VRYAIAYSIAYFVKIHILHIFPHIMEFSTSHMQKLSYMLHMQSHFSAFSLSNVCSRLIDIFHLIFFTANDYQYLQLDIKKIEIENVETA